MTDQLQTAKDWLGDLSKIVSRQKTKEDYEYAKKRTEALDWLIQQAERVEELKNRCTEIAAESTAQEEKLLKEKQWLEKRVEELENRSKELEYASKFNGALNEFLQERKLPPSTLGRHVVDVVMEYVEELEKEVNHWKLCTNSEQKIAAKAHKRVERVEKENRRLKQALKNIEELWANREFNDNLAWDMLLESRQALKGESQ